MTTNTVPGISALQCVISSLRDTAHLSDEGGELTDQLRELRDWALSTAAQPPADGALNTIAALRAQLAEAQRDAERLDWIIEHRAYVVSDPDCCDGLTYDHIVALALEHGFKLKPQVDGRMALNDYVIDFACAVYDIGHAAAIAKATGRVVADDAAPERTVSRHGLTQTKRK